MWKGSQQPSGLGDENERSPWANEPLELLRPGMIHPPRRHKLGPGEIDVFLFPEHLGNYNPQYADTWWWFQTFFISPLPGEMIQFDYSFSDGLKPPTSIL